MKRLPLLFLLAVPSAEARFYTRENLPERPQNFERAYAAALRLEEINGAGDHCSAISVSHDGYVLTNLHCVEKCLRDAGFAERGLADVKSEYYTILKTKNQRPHHLVCGNLDWDDSEGQTHGDGVVVWLGKGTQTFSDVNVESIPTNVFREVLAYQDDFAILKYDLPKPTACVPLAASAPQPGDKVWGVSYPSFTMRYDGFDSSGYKKHISLGAVMTDLRADAYLSANLKTETQWSMVSDAYLRPEQLLTGLDSMHGSSGSMVVDRDGALIGVHYSNTAPSAERMKVDLGSNSIALRTDHVLAELRAGLGAQAASRIFNCPDSSAASAPAPAPRRAPAPPAVLSVPSSAFDGAKPLP